MPNRRNVLLASTASLVAAGLPALSGAAYADVDGFLTLSERLTERRELDRRLATQFYMAFESDWAGLRRLAEGGETNRPLARAVVSAWYSGVVDRPTGPAVVTFDQALVWRAADFATPPGLCRGTFGDWAVAPRAAG